MNKTKLAIILALSLTLIGIPIIALGNTSFKVIKGSNPIETSIKVAGELDSSSNTYIITTDKDYPDALAGTVLASKHNAPILFVTAGDNKQIFDYLRTQNADSSTKFYILGGTSAVSASVETELRKISGNITRLGGADRYETDGIINKYIEPQYNTPIILATGLNYPDALAMGPIGGKFQYPIFLANKNAIPVNLANQIKEINPKTIYIAGGTTVIPVAIETQAKKIAPQATTIRLGGADRYKTAELIESHFKNSLSQRIYTTGRNFHNALLASPLASKHNAAIILVDNVTPEQELNMQNQSGYQVGDITYSGGSQGLKPAITSLSEADIKRLQSYPVAGEKGKGFFVSFEDFYTNERSEVDAILRDFTPVTLSTFKDARVEWLTDPKLVYFSWTAQYCVRGIISVTYYEEPNPFGLTQNVTYQREVEYRISNAVHNGQIKQTLEQTKYLSDWQAVRN